MTTLNLERTIFFKKLFLHGLTRQININNVHLHIQIFTLTRNVNKFITYIYMMGISKTKYNHNTNSNLSIFPVHVTIAHVVFPITLSSFNVCFQLLLLFLLPSFSLFQLSSHHPFPYSSHCVCQIISSIVFRKPFKRSIGLILFFLGFIANFVVLFANSMFSM